MSQPLRNRYHARMRRVIDHVDRHLDGDLALETLSAVAAFSPFHFHGQFAAMFGLPVHRYVQLARLKRASQRLLRGGSVTEVALDAGFAAPDAFARAFRRRFDQSPSAFRRAPDWQAWLAALVPFDEARSKLMPTWSTADVTIRELAPTPVAVMEHRGDPATVPATVARLIAWRQAHGLRPATSTTFAVFHSDPRTTPAADFRMDLCVGTDRPVAEDGAVTPGLIPGGRCAVLRIIGAADDLEPAALFLYRDWLPASGEELRDFPLFCRRVAFFPAAPEHEAVTHLFLPLR